MYNELKKSLRRPPHLEAEEVARLIDALHEEERKVLVKKGGGRRGSTPPPAPITPPTEEKPPPKVALPLAA